MLLILPSFTAHTDGKGNPSQLPALLQSSHLPPKFAVPPQSPSEVISKKPVEFVLQYPSAKHWVSFKPRQVPFGAMHCFDRVFMATASRNCWFVASGSPHLALAMASTEGGNSFSKQEVSCCCI